MHNEGQPYRKGLLILLVILHTLICCVSFAYIPELHDKAHILYDPAQLHNVAVIVAAFALVSFLFAFADFTFGYFVGFYFYTMIVGYLWINYFSDLGYDHQMAGLSAAGSAVAFLLPALFISSPIKPVYVLSQRTFDRLLMLVVLLSIATIAVGANYNFRLVAPGDASDLRGDSFPAILKYLIEITSSTLLPFLFACFVTRSERWRAGAILLLLLFVYPIAMSKVAFFTPIWLVAMVLLSRILEARIAVILSLSAPILAGVVLFALFKSRVVPYDIAIPFFETVNFRMIAVPSNAMNVYNDFFSRHELTHFCQLWVLKPIVGCPYQEPLSIVMRNAYPFGANYNASLFATEGIASVGMLFAPVAAFGCGLVVALGNRLSAGLPPNFVLISGAVLPQIFLNVPLSTILLTHGAGLLFLLWYLTPRNMFQQEMPEHAAGAGRA